MRPDNDVHEVFRLAELGLSRAEIARQVGIARATVKDWLDHGLDAVLNRPMRIGATRRTWNRGGCGSCGDQCEHRSRLDESAYAYLLGQYLGDGCISPIRYGFRLRLACCDAYPDIMAECEAAIRAIVPAARLGRIANVGCTEVYCTWPHWPCLFPQHGPGPKHTRPIVLEAWQREIALDRNPDWFIRGLIHSDGCRCINRVTVRGKRYEYLRYLFSNESGDIRALFFEACTRLGVSARLNRRNSISVARRDSVQLLEEFVGPKS